MSFILLGILNSQAAGAAPGGAGDYELLESTVLTSSASSVTFSSLNSTYGSTYKHLQIRMVARTDEADTQSFVQSRINGDSTSSYSIHSLLGNGSSVTSFASTSQTQMNFGPVAGATASSNIFGSIVIDYLDPFDTSKNTTVRALQGLDTSRVQLGSGGFFKTNAVDSIILFNDDSSNYITGSRFSLYGLKESA